MRIFIDTNVLLDALENRMPYAPASKRVISLCEEKIIQGVISTLSFANIIYIMRKRLDSDKIEYIHKNLSEIFSFASMTAEDVANAVRFRWADYEDALQAATAQRIGADFLITRNTRDFAYSPVMCMEPIEFLESIDIL